MSNVPVHSRGTLRSTVPVVVVIVVALMVASCYPDYGLTVEDYDAVATYYDATNDFGQYKTFYLIDTVGHVLPPGVADNITREYDQVMLTSVLGNLEALGYRETTNVASADIAVQVSLTRQDYLRFYSWRGYWGWGWPWYYPPIYTYSYSAGTIVVDMVDVKKSIPGNLGVSVWMALLQGLAESSTINTQQRIRNGVNQAFNQSPYLGSSN